MKNALKEKKNQEWAMKTELLQRRVRASVAGGNTYRASIAKMDGARQQAEATESVWPEPKESIWMARHLDLVKELLQIIMLFTCGQIALYVLSLRYGIEVTHIGAGWHLFALFPPITVLFWLLPHLCWSIGMFEAYAVPNMPILDNVRGLLAGRYPPPARCTPVPYECMSS